VKQLAEVTEAAEILERTPVLLDAWLLGLSEPWLSAREGEGTWSALEVVAHLAHNEETDWMPRLERLLQFGEEQPFEPYEREGFRTRFPEWPLERLLPRFSAARRENLDRLLELGLRPVDLNRTGMHPALGRVTVRQLLAGWVVHDLTHLAQVARVLAKRYGETVGPWRDYMGVLGDRTK
jgi:DinB superfamily